MSIGPGEEQAKGAATGERSRVGAIHSRPGPGDFLRLLRSASEVPSEVEGPLHIFERGTVSGLEAEVRATYAPDGRFFVEVRSLLSSKSGFDGSEVGWLLDATGHVRDLAGADLEEALLIQAVLHHRWLRDPEAQAWLREPPVRTGSGFRAPLALPGGRIVVDLAWTAQGELERIEHRAGHERCTFVGPGRPSPWGRISEALRERHGWLEDRVERRPVSSPDWHPQFERPLSSTPGTHFFSPSGSIEVRRTRRGALPLIRPLLGGEEQRSFLFDTGASSLAVASAVADKLQMESLGRTWVETTDGGAGACFRRGASLLVGPLEIRDASFLEVDGSALSQMFGTPIAGICGYDLFARARVRLGSESLELYAPEVPADESLPWIPTRLEGCVPVVRAETPAGPVDLAIDTGSSAKAHIYPEAQRRLGLKPTKARHTRGTGLTGGVPLAKAKLETLRIGAAEWERLEVVLSTSKVGASGDPTRDGTLGFGALKTFLLELDYPRGRLALVSRRGSG